jgi:hypothetical protein
MQCAVNALHPVALSVAIALIGGNWPGLVTGGIITIECTDNEHDTTFRWLRRGGGRLFGVVREIAEGTSHIVQASLQIRRQSEITYPGRRLSLCVAG